MSRFSDWARMMQWQNLLFSSMIWTCLYHIGRQAGIASLNYLGMVEQRTSSYHHSFDLATYDRVWSTVQNATCAHSGNVWDFTSNVDIRQLSAHDGCYAGGPIAGVKEHCLASAEAEEWGLLGVMLALSLAVSMMIAVAGRPFYHNIASRRRRLCTRESKSNYNGLQLVPIYGTTASPSVSHRIKALSKALAVHEDNADDVSDSELEAIDPARQQEKRVAMAGFLSVGLNMLELVIGAAMLAVRKMQFMASSTESGAGCIAQVAACNFCLISNGLAPLNMSTLADAATNETINLGRQAVNLAAIVVLALASFLPGVISRVHCRDIDEQRARTLLPS